MKQRGFIHMPILYYVFGISLKFTTLVPYVCGRKLNYSVDVYYEHYLFDIIKYLHSIIVEGLL